MKRISAEALVIGLFVLFGLGVRLATLTGPLDEPSWRQTDTTYMALRMGREWPPEVLLPKAPYRGNNDVKAAEFPIYPLICGLIYHAAGGENLALARLVTLGFFLGALGYLFKIVELFFDRRLAWISMAVYLALPLGVFYSRAVHPDYCIIFFAHAYLYYALRFYQTRRWRWFMLSSVMASAAFLMKAPYCFYLALPLAAWVFYNREGRTFGNLVTMGALFIVPLALGWWFNEYRIALEAPHVESLLYPMKWTRDFTFRWFFGTLDERLNLANWSPVVHRVLLQVVTPVGLYAVLMAVLTPGKPEHRRGRWGLGALCAGVVVFALTVFPHFSSTHDYYSLPLLAPASILIALFLVFLAQAGDRGGAARLAITLAALWAGSAYGLKRHDYFRHDWQRLQAGAAMAQYTASQDLIVSVTLGRSTGWSDPRILYFADRKGWAIELANLTEEVLGQYRQAGARYVALLITPEYPVTDDQFPLLAPFPHRVHELRDPRGELIGHLVLFEVGEELNAKG